MKNHLIISLVIGILLSAAALYFAFRNVPLSDLLHYLKSINYLWTFPAAILALVSFFFRALRWQFILASSHKIGIWRAFHPMMIGFMINCILPGRVGEVARPAVLQKKENIPFSTGLATVAAERFFDVSILVVLLAVMLATVQIDPDLDIVFGGYHLNRATLVAAGEGTFKLLLILIVGIALVGFGKTRNIINGLITRIPSVLFFAGPEFKKRILKRVCEPMVRFVDNFASGFTLVKYPTKICACIGLSFFIWGLAAFSYYLMALGCPGIELSFVEITAVMIIICFFIALPSVPGYWGIWEAGGVFALLLFFKRCGRLYSGKSCNSNISCYHCRDYFRNGNQRKHITGFI